MVTGEGGSCDTAREGFPGFGRRDLFWVLFSFHFGLSGTTPILGVKGEGCPNPKRPVWPGPKEAGSVRRAAWHDRPRACL